MPFDPNHPSLWIDEITANQSPLLRCLCKSLYHEPLLVRWATHALLCKWGMTAEGRVGLPEDGMGVDRRTIPSADRILIQDDEQYALLVRQEDPNALNPGATNPWPFAVAAFKRCGGVMPVAVPDACQWRLFHLYDDMTHLVVGNRVESERAGRQFTQAAALVAAHPVVYHLKGEHACIESTLRAKAFTRFNYDPLNLFAPETDHDNCGFII
jgi:hypothetical protein